MSIEWFESGKKLGLTSSLIAVIAPILFVITYVVFYISLFSRLIANPSSSATSSYPLFLTVASYAIAAVTIAGLILFVVAMYRLSHYYDEPIIFRSTLYGLVINIVGALVAIVFVSVYIGSLIRSLPQGSTTQSASYSPVQGITPIPTFPTLTSIFAIITAFVIFLIVVFIIGIVSAIFYFRAFNKLGEKSGNHNFNTAGLLILIGTVLTIVLFGGIIFWIGWIFAMSGFNSLKPKPPIPPTGTYFPPQIPPADLGQKKICPTCGSENSLNAVYCSTCGRKLQ